MNGDLFLEVDGVNTEVEAVRWALNAAVQQRQNTVYRSDLRREEFREVFKSAMRTESLAYKQFVSEHQHCATIRCIADNLSKEFNGILNDGRLRYGTAQKAFNLYLKYLWRLKMILAPPHCPVDGVVLKAVGLMDRWTESDSEGDYLRWIAAIRKHSEPRGLSIAEWEHEIWLRWRIEQNQKETTALPKVRTPSQHERPKLGESAPSVSTADSEFDRAYMTAPVCWSYDSARPRFIYLSRDNRESTQASFRFDYKAVIHKLRQGKLTKNGYKYFELAK